MKRVPLRICVFLLAGCASVQTQPTVPTRHVAERGQMLLYSDFELASDHRLLDELQQVREDLVTALQLPTTEERIFFYLFEDPGDYDRFMRLHYPELPPRRAYFIQTDTRLIVYAQWGDHIVEDLRHEATHGWLHAVVPHIPVWIDEGIAEHFEVPRSLAGFHAAHANLLLAEHRAGRWQPNLAALEQRQTLHEMSQLNYAESWAWVHFLLHSDPPNRELLTRYLRELAAYPEVPPLSARMRGIGLPFEEMLLAHLSRLASRHGTAETAHARRDVVVRSHE